MAFDLRAKFGQGSAGEDELGGPHRTTPPTPTTYPPATNPPSSSTAPSGQRTVTASAAVASPNPKVSSRAPWLRYDDPVRTRSDWSRPPAFTVTTAPRASVPGDLPCRRRTSACPPSRSLRSSRGLPPLVLISTSRSPSPSTSPTASRGPPGARPAPAPTGRWRRSASPGRRSRTAAAAGRRRSRAARR